MGIKWIKVLSMALCTVLLISVTACSSGTGNQASKADTPLASEASQAVPETPQSNGPADPLGKYEETLVLTTVRALDSDVKFDANNPKYKSITDNVWSQLYKEALNIEFEYLWTPTTPEYETKWNIAIASGDIPDVAMVQQNTYKELVNAGLIEDMTACFEEYALDEYKQLNKDDDGLTIDFMTFDGKLLGLPMNGSQPDNVNLMFIRKDWLDKVGKPVPTTVDELVDVAQAFVDAKLGGEDTYGICVNKNINSGQNNIAGFLNGYGAYYNTWLLDNGSLVFSTIQPQMKDALLKLQEMYKSGLLSQDFAVKDDGMVGADIASGKVGIAYGTFWAPLATMRENIVSDETADWIVVTPPTADGSLYKTQADAQPGNFIFVKKGIANPEAAVKLMNLGLVTPEKDANGVVYGNDLETGIEVFKYAFGSGLLSAPWKNLVNHNMVVPALDSHDPSKLNEEQLAAYDQIVAAENGDRGGIGMDLVFGRDSTFKFVGEWKENGQILVNEFLSLPTDTMSTSSELLKTSLDAAILKVIMGDDISTFDKAVEAWKNGGGDKITSEVNAWYSSKK